jgi:cytochrome P450
MHDRAQSVPSHVPRNLIRPYPFVLGARTRSDPFNELVPAIHQGPEIFYSPENVTATGPAWIVRRAADLRCIYQDTGNFSSANASPFAEMLGEDWLQIPFEIDPPAHKAYRSIVNPLFFPKAVNALDAKMRFYARQSATALAGRGTCEFLADFAFTFPIQIFLELMNLPQTEIKTFLEWETGLLHPSDKPQLLGAARHVVDFLRDLIEQRKRKPGDDIISHAVKAYIEGRKLNDDELLGYSFNLFIGGLDTVSSNICLHFWHLAKHGAHQKLLRENPALITPAIEEFLRAYANVTTFRTCTNPTTVSGVTFMPGDKIAMSTTLAGRDPQEYERPNDVVLDRDPRHLSFAHGPHVCVGMNLARREIKVAMEEFLAAVPQFELAQDADIEFLVHTNIQPVALPLQWDAVA